MDPPSPHRLVVHVHQPLDHLHVSYSQRIVQRRPFVLLRLVALAGERRGYERHEEQHWQPGVQPHRAEVRFAQGAPGFKTHASTGAAVCRASEPPRYGRRAARSSKIQHVPRASASTGCDSCGVVLFIVHISELYLVLYGLRLGKRLSEISRRDRIWSSTGRNSNYSIQYTGS